MARANRVANKEDVFLSWSGPRSLYVAKFFHAWLRNVVQRVKPWLSEQDIEKGTVGIDQIHNALAGTRVGIFFLTPENRDSTWISYEAGALANQLGDKTRVCTYLLGGLQVHHINGPLGVFQGSKADKEDTRKLIHTINRAVEGEIVPQENLDVVFDKMWPELEAHLQKMPQSEQMPKPLPSSDEMIAEILELSRAAANSRKQTEWLDQLAPDFKDIFPAIAQAIKGLPPSQLLPAPAPPPPREPKGIFCIKLFDDPVIKRVEGVFGIHTPTGGVVVMIGDEMVARFESVENWWRERPTDNPASLTATAKS